MEDFYKIKFFDLADELYYINYAKENKVIYNKAWTKFLGWSEEELIEKHVEGLIAPEDRALAYEKIEAAQRGENVGEFLLRLITKSGDIKAYYFSGYGEKEAGIAYAVGRDVTEDTKIRKILEREKSVFNQARVSMMSDMVQAMAHHWRQPLSSISLSFDLIAFDYADGILNPKSIKEHSTTAKTVISKLSKNIDSLAGIFSERYGEKQHPNEIIGSVVEIVSGELDAMSIVVISDIIGYEKNACEIKSPDIKQIIWGLLTNAKDAILTKKMVSGEFDGVIRISFIKEEGVETIVVEDNGIGVQKGSEDRIFEPFFTTKERGVGFGVVHGEGLGLYILKTIISIKLGGTIDVLTSNGATRATVRLPV